MVSILYLDRTGRRLRKKAGHARVERSKKGLGAVGLSGLVSSAMLCAIGCAKVEPAADFERAAQLIQERTGSPDVFDPLTEQAVSERVDTLLSDGLTVEEAVQIALLNNRGLQSAFQEIGVSRAEVVQSGLLTNPSFSMIFRLPESGGRPNSEFSLGQQLVDLWQIPVRRQIAEAQLEAAILDVAQRAINLATDVRIRAYELLALDQAEAALRESLRLVESSLQIAQRQLDAGTVSPLDVNLTRSSVIQVRVELIALERERRVTAIALARLMNLSRRPELLNIEDRLPPPTAVADNELLVFAMRQRLDARQVELRARQAEAELKREYLTVFPSLELGFNVEVSNRQSLPGRNLLADTARASIANGGLTAPDIDSRAERDLTRRQIVDALLGPSLAFTVPIWDQNQAGIATARYRVVQQRKACEDLLDRVASEIREALAVTENAGTLVHVYEQEALPQAQAGVDGARSLYEVGRQGIIVLIEAQEAYILRRREYARALGAYAVALAELERALGGRMPPAAASQPSSRPESSQLDRQ